MMNRYINNQNGSTVFYLIWGFFLMGMLLILTFNIVNIYVVKNQANIAADQASMAASSEVYKSIKDVISDYEPPGILGLLEEEEETLAEKIEEEIESLETSHGYLSTTETEIRAINNVLNDELTTNNHLRSEISESINDSLPSVINVVEKVLEQNNAIVTGSKITLFNEDLRVEVMTSTEYNTTEYSSMMPTLSEDIDQKGVGLSVSFADLTGWSSWEYVFD
ncbi:hypothetical protein [Salipaludibacillus daqingensis]|uniref:hypothetical protein n=1 Tax=Salipaludibacillus daqingensis TaxID=3041001 RepID=UPI002473BA8C|nr:hypothetical protein [Salipaludibacillus daqingensis]